MLGSQINVINVSLRVAETPALYHRARSEYFMASHIPMASALPLPSSPGYQPMRARNVRNTVYVPDAKERE